MITLASFADVGAYVETTGPSINFTCCRYQREATARDSILSVGDILLYRRGFGGLLRFQTGNDLRQLVVKRNECVIAESDWKALSASGLYLCSWAVSPLSQDKDPSGQAR